MSNCGNDGADAQNGEAQERKRGGFPSALLNHFQDVTGVEIVVGFGVRYELAVIWNVQISYVFPPFLHREAAFHQGTERTNPPYSLVRVSVRLGFIEDVLADFLQREQPRVGDEGDGQDDESAH